MTSVVNMQEFQRRVAEASPPNDNVLLTSGGEGDNGGMEPRVAKLESAVEFMQRDIAEVKTDLKEVRRDIVAIRTTDFRLIFGAIIVVAWG